MAVSVGNDSSMDDLDVPPLEDMSDVLQKVLQMKEVKSSSKASAISEAPANQQHFNQQCAAVKTTEKISEKHNGGDRSFGGMKKGFLFGGSSKNVAKCSRNSTTQAKQADINKSAEEDIPFIRPNKEASQNQFRLDEVQRAMKPDEAFTMNKEWVTDDLLQRIQSNAELCQRLQDPTFIQAINEFQVNPQAAIHKYQDNVAIQTFFKDFCSILGDHFSSFGDQKSAPSAQSSPPVKIHSPDGSADLTVVSSRDSRTGRPKSSSDDDESKVNKILADAELRDILLDPKIQQLIEMLRTSPDRAQMLLQQADADLRMKVARLVDAGLLQFQH